MNSRIQALQAKMQGVDTPRYNSVDLLDELELLSVVLNICGVRIKCEEIALDMLNVFGSFSEVVAAPVCRLTEINGVARRTAVNIRSVYASARKIGSTTLRENRRRIDDKYSVMEYCRTNMAMEQVEQLRVLFLNRQNRLLADEIHQRGTVDQIACYPRELVKRALEISATAMILLQNHPSGEATPTNAEVAMTRALDEIARAIGIRLHDHIIVSRSELVSMRERKLF